MKFNLSLEEIKYVKIIYKDINNKPCAKKAALKRANEKEFLICTKFEDIIEIETPQEITLSIICQDGLYRTKAILKKIENDEPYTFFVIDPPAGLEYQQNREFFRILVKQECTYCVHTNAGTVNIPATTYDLSANGISIDIETALIPQEDASILLNINDNKIKSRVKFVRKESIPNGYRLSFFFTNISEADRDLISQFCLKKQLEQRRNALF